MAKLSVDIWSDIACPWCYVGKRRLEAALARFPYRGELDVRWRAFELDPRAPRVREAMPYLARLAKKYGTSPTEAEEMVTRMVGVAAAEGLAFDFDHIQPGNTFDAHRLLHLAHAHGVQDAVKERFFRAYLVEGQAIGDTSVLARLGTEAGLDRDEVGAVLATDAHAREVREDEEDAQALGVTGVPFFVFGRRRAVSGAQSAEVLLGAMQRAWDEAGADDANTAEGGVCGVDGCAVGGVGVGG